jgi:hypothetical protein
MRVLRLVVIFGVLAMPASASAWGYEGHEVVADLARAYMSPAVLAKVDAILSTDQDNNLTPHDMPSEATWADRFRGAGHPETGAWHFVDTELDKPNLRQACFDYPPSGPLASRGPAQDCVINKIDEFAKELADPATTAPERLLALKFLLHFVGDLHQPLHASDNHDKGGNCVLLALGGPRAVNLHSYWDTAVVQAMGTDPAVIARTLAAKITPAMKTAWEKGDTKDWALEAYQVSKSTVYTIGSKPGCDGDQGAVSLPAGYDQSAQAAAAIQLEKAGVRLALLLNNALGH